MTSANTDPAVEHAPRRRHRPRTVPTPQATEQARRKVPRQRNPRGQGERLRDDIVEAASRLLADPAAPPLTLRAVAREAGVAATSVYLHFDDIQSLILAVADRRFGELVQLQDSARNQATDPCQQVRD